jgi:bacillithiol biosynthesis cysteine-adding enzyme BshC
MQAVIEKATVDLAETYHAQIRPRALNLFTLTDGGRLALDASDDCDSVSIRGADRDLSMTELQQRIESSPESFSPSVALRPIAQDTLLPTAVYVAGPSEIAYFAQLKPAYDLAQIPMPIIYPRASVTVLPSRTAGQLADAGLAIGDLARPLDELFAELVEASMEVDLSESFAFEVAAIDEIVNRLKGIAEAVEVTLGKSAEATRAAVHKEIDRFKGRVLKAEKNKHEVLRGRLERLRAQVFPLDGLQERKLSAVHYLCRYGPGFLERLREQVDLDTRNHQIVVLD